MENNPFPYIAGGALLLMAALFFGTGLQQKALLAGIGAVALCYGLFLTKNK